MGVLAIRAAQRLNTHSGIHSRRRTELGKSRKPTVCESQKFIICLSNVVGDTLF